MRRHTGRPTIAPIVLCRSLQSLTVGGLSLFLSLIRGLSNLCANLGGLCATYALGSIRDATDSFAIGFYLLSALCISAIGGAVLLGRIRPLGEPSREMLVPAGSAAAGPAAERLSLMPTIGLTAHPTARPTARRTA